MKRIKWMLLICACSVTAVYGQKTDRDYLRSGNKLYKDSLFVKAEVDYRKALEVNPKSADALYNLGNSLLMQEKGKEAMEQLDAASRLEKDKEKLAHIYHNMGVILQASKQLPQCIEAYKQALRNNPKDDETRYNLALAQKQLKDQQQQQDQNQQQEQKQDQKQDEKEQNKDQQDQIRDKKNREENWVENLSLREAINRLNQRERHIIDLRFYEGKTQMEVAQEIGISQAQVSRLEKNALKTMRNYLRA